MRDGVRAEYAARTARVQAALDTANQALMEERLSKADMSVQLAALRSERRAYQATMSDAETRIAAAFSDLRAREEALAQAAIEKRDLERQLARLDERLAAAGLSRPSGPSSAEDEAATGPVVDLAATVAMVAPVVSVDGPTPVVTVGEPTPVVTAGEPAVVIAGEEQVPLEAVGKADADAVDEGRTDVAAAAPGRTDAREPVTSEPAVPEGVPSEPVTSEPVLSEAAPSEATPSEPVTPEPLQSEPAARKTRPVARIAPDVAAAIAERLRSARERALSEAPVVRDDGPPATLPPVAPWSVALPPPDPEPEPGPSPEITADPGPQAPSKPRKARRPGVARISRATPAVDPEGAPPATRPGTFASPPQEDEGSGPTDTPPAPKLVPDRMDSPEFAEAAALPVAPLEPVSEPRPVPVVRRAAPVPVVDAPEGVAPEPFDPIANLPPRSTDPARATFQFPTIPVPVQDDEDDLDPDDRDRRVASLARRLLALRSRGRVEDDDATPPAKSGSS
jgi:hypothetical protein